MVNIRELLYPNKFKVTLFLLLAIPCITLITVLLGTNYNYYNYYPPHFTYPFLISLFLFLAIGLVLSYILSSSIDHFIPNEKIKISIAIISGMTSIIIVYIFYKMVTEPIICDPVHIPANNQTVCDPVHQPIQGKSYNIEVLDGLDVDKSLVEDSLTECIRNLKS
ncbi:hypothetical protein [Methanobacterium sp.]|uniref:hypothetical protein n=1 Tax=Methanobacterium sp. TaxID=2164 RepID=UPI0025FE4FD0|nr:hypothetical protein [Methanobacterium sp.]MBI5460516.1 hypothetical protein [Methanobacterium sp.]